MRKIGWQDRRLENIYSINAVTVGSDKTLKDLHDIDVAERAAALEIGHNIRKYKLWRSIEKEGFDGARWHFGVAAQDVGEIMRRHGLDPHAYSWFCLDTWEATPEVWDEWPDEYEIFPAVIDGDGNEIAPARRGKLIREAGRTLVEEGREAGSQYGIRYQELEIFIIDALVHHIDALVDHIDTRFAEIEARLTALE